MNEFMSFPNCGNCAPNLPSALSPAPNIREIPLTRSAAVSMIIASARFLTALHVDSSSMLTPDIKGVAAIINADNCNPNATRPIPPRVAIPAIKSATQRAIIEPTSIPTPIATFSSIILAPIINP